MNMTRPDESGAQVAALDWEARPSASRRHVFVGAGLGLVTFLAYLPGLGRSLDFDSAQTVGMFVRPGPPWNAFRLQAVFNNHPFFSFFEQLVRVVTGQSDAATMRLLPILFGAAAVGVLTWFTVRRHGVAAGLVAGGLLAANPTFVDLSRSVRGYSLLVLCAVVATILVAEDRPGRSAWYDVAYVSVAGIGLGTHLYMLPVIAAHAGVVVVRKQFDGRWRRRFLGAAVIAAVAYAGMASVMVEAMGAHARVFQPDLPWRVAGMAAGGGWAAALAVPLVVAGAVLVLRRSAASRGAAAALIAVLLVVWAGLQSSALTERFFVWLVPGAAYLAAVAVGRMRAGVVLAAGSVAIALTAAAAGYAGKPTGYRQAASAIRVANAGGSRSCVVNVGVSPMLAYLDTPRDFAAVTDPAQLDRCDLVLLAAWWPTDAGWYAPDRRVLAEAERRFPHRLVVEAKDPVLIFSDRSLQI